MPGCWTGIDAANLVIVTKFTMGDFYSWLPLNPTLEQGAQPRIIEFQSRREFEAFSSFPNYLSADHQQALQHFERANPNIDGVWVWTQDGGPVAGRADVVVPQDRLLAVVRPRRVRHRPIGLGSRRGPRRRQLGVDQAQLL
ncbi:MAG: hypothetical protein V9E82_11085 [Candidatus Nanopelagicales bacterium]